jgi:hypothetical protein
VHTWVHTNNGKEGTHHNLPQMHGLEVRCHRAHSDRFVRAVVVAWVYECGVKYACVTN